MPASEEHPKGPRSVSPAAETSLTPAQIIYGLYALGYFTGGLTTLAGVVYAYVARGDAHPALRSHLTFQIRSFWISILLVLAAAAAMLSFVGAPLGWALAVFLLLWSLTRLVSGAALAFKSQAVSKVGALGLFAS